MRNKDSGFGGPKHLSDAKAKPFHGALRPDGSIKPRPQERAQEGAAEHRNPD